MGKLDELSKIIDQGKMDLEYFKASILMCELYYNLPNLNLAYKEAAANLMRSSDFDEYFEILLDAYTELQQERNKLR